jgi:hypothetical protein
LSVGDCRQGRRDHDNNESKGAQFTHDVHSSLGLGVTTITAGVCSHILQRPTDMATTTRDVCFTPESGHSAARRKPLHTAAIASIASRKFGFASPRSTQSVLAGGYLYFRRVVASSP